MSCIADVGTPSSNFQGWERAEVRFHGFAELPAEAGDFKESSEFTCLGHQWTLKIYPGGDRDSDEGMVAIFLDHVSDEPINVNVMFGFSIKDLDAREIACTCGGNDGFDRHGPWCGWGEEDFAKRSTILKSLVEGTLVIEVEMILAYPSYTFPLPFIPDNPSACNAIQKMFMDEKSADVVFQIEHQKGDSNAKNERKKAKTSPTTFHAHRLILQRCAPQLAELCGPIENNSSPVSISIPDVTPVIFHHILNYIYGGEVPSKELEANAKEIIDATDKYGVSNLKLTAEACLVKSTTIDVNNVMELLLYSDSKNCALLKEAVMDFIVENHAEVLAKVSFEGAPTGPTMFRDVLAAMTREKRKSGDAPSEEDQFGSMRISELRRRAHAEGLEVDSSRETLIAALKERSSES